MAFSHSTVQPMSPLRGRENKTSYFSLSPRTAGITIATIMGHIGDWCFEQLPDFSGILLAAVGVAIAVAPSFIDKLPKSLRWIMAGILAILGIAGMSSSSIQHHNNETDQGTLRQNVADLKKSEQSLRTVVDSYGPKLDSIIAHPDCAGQKDLAEGIKTELSAQLLALRQKYSATQVVNTLPPFMGGNALIHLDNTADLKLSGSYSASSAQLSLIAPFVENGPYRVTGVEIQSDQFTATDKPEQVFAFDTIANVRHEITADHRTFTVTLLNARILHVPQIAQAYQYTFGVHEK